MLETSRLHVKGGVDPSSKKERGTVAVVGRLYVVLVKEVAEAMFGGCKEPCLPLGCPSLLFRRFGDAPFIESIEVEGDKTPLVEARSLPYLTISDQMRGGV